MKKSQKSDNPKEEYKKINLEDLDVLKSEVDMYIIQLEIPEDDMYDEDLDFDDCEIEEEFY